MHMCKVGGGGVSGCRGEIAGVDIHVYRILLLVASIVAAAYLLLILSVFVSR